MAEYGEWNQKGASLSDVTAKKEYGVDREIIIQGIQTGNLEYREGVMWGNPYFRILRSQLERYIASEMGEDYLRKVKAQTELRSIKKEISETKRKLSALQDRKSILEELLKNQ
jgi:hypothetical protein